MIQILCNPVGTGTAIKGSCPQIVERSGTLFFSFQHLDSTKPAGRLIGWTMDPRAAES